MSAGRLLLAPWKLPVTMPPDLDGVPRGWEAGLFVCFLFFLFWFFFVVVCFFQSFHLGGLTASLQPGLGASFSLLVS